MTVSLPQWTAVRTAPIRKLESLPGQLDLFADDVVDAQPDALHNVPAHVPEISKQLGESNERASCIAKSTSRPIKWHGGKQPIAPWIISLMPPRAKRPSAPAADDPGWLHYVEPYFGGGAVLLALNPNGISEVVNDLNDELTNFWDVLRSPEQFPQLEHWLKNTPCSQVEFERSLYGHQHSDPVVRAGYFFIRNRQSRQALGRHFATLTRNRTRRGMNELPSAWWSSIDSLPEFHARLQRVVILDDEACDVIGQQDGPRTLFYIDPPYLLNTRSSAGEYGEFEMTEQDHRRLLETLVGIKGRFLLSGYRSTLYDAYAAEHGWVRHERGVDLKSSSKKAKERRTECVWTNY
jgi:DNA adenine methylase